LLVCILAALVGLDVARRSSWGLLVTTVALSAALLIKGLFVAFPLMAAVSWLATNPTMRTGSVWRPVAALSAALVGLVAVTLVYETLYRHATGESFLLAYWRLQVAPVDIATPGTNLGMLVRHAAFYVSRLLWHPAPWTFIAIGLLGRRGLSWWGGTSPQIRRALTFVGLFAGSSVILLSPSGRVAERYVFAATYVVGAAAAVASYRGWGVLRRMVDRADRAVPALPALVWVCLMLSRLAVGPLIPRI
jgi:hypothetical protein